jgi:hypothetical protein
MPIAPASLASERGSDLGLTPSNEPRPSIREVCLVASSAADAGDCLVRSGRAYAVLAADGAGHRRYAHLAVLA